ncbi:DUF4148 domain-containing protein [Burkholderia cepacia]|uniref:DUF4148 domain-containing protein n=1 Tax=Burkholderia cepacia TaxID=292 RepID=UPI0009BD8E08|nr:DUF4148 domain-containing protein [Burkholderia cepacia]RQT72436.1 DUF4148 domain-containing protein [Burkholderia cepacia]RQT92342.1 DUF4148 domain-containing protein [Burkholderia cepacia]RQZ69326.1 DUF4148 domain-containing protein [Burkholderia cepacia]RQZ98758.1 DUF4148 domain-containing protein [Burkholderia cepacia]RRA02737.1 DUF4148 domain-containing protein [Burkholderia cepacia]
MYIRLTAALLVAVSASAAAPAFAHESTMSRAQVRAELVQVEQAGYRPGRANDPHYPDDLQAALTRVHANDAVTSDAAASGYGRDAVAATQSGSGPATRIAERSIYFGH